METAMYYQTIVNGLCHNSFKRYQDTYPARKSFYTMAMSGIKPGWLIDEERKYEQRLCRLSRSKFC